MTDGERHAFTRGFAYACEQMIDAHEPLLRIGELWRIHLERDELDALSEAVGRWLLSAMKDVGEARIEGAEKALELFEIEQAIYG